MECRQLCDRRSGLVLASVFIAALSLTSGCGGSDSGGGGTGSTTGIVRVDLTDSTYQLYSALRTSTLADVPDAISRFRICVVDPATNALLVPCVEVVRQSRTGHQIVEITGVPLRRVGVLVEALDASGLVVATSGATTTVQAGTTGVTIVVNPVVTVAAVSPARGPLAGGTTVTVSGSNFSSPLTVAIGGLEATAVTVTSSTTLTCKTPAASSTGAKDVVAASDANGPGMLASGFTYVPGTEIAGASPSHGPAAGGTTVRITGTAFESITGVFFGPTPAASFNVDSTTQITCVSPPGLGTVSLIVDSSTLGSATKTDAYTFYQPPTISSITPARGLEAGSQNVTITGSNFIDVTGASGVQFGAADALSYTVDSTTQISCVSPPGTGTVNVTVNSTSLGSASAASFTYRPPMTVTSRSPDKGLSAGSQTVTITGTGFYDVTHVWFGAAAGSNLAVTPSQISCLSPAGSGMVTLNVSSSTLGSASAGSFTYLDPLSITTVDPPSGPDIGGSTVTITGTSFYDVTQVLFGSTQATTSSVTPLEIVCVAPAGPTGNVSLTVVSSTLGSDSAVFTYNPPMSITSCLPDAGQLAGTTNVTVLGTNLHNVTGVTFGASAAVLTGASPPDEVGCQTPPGTGTVGVTVTSSTHGTAYKASAFTYAGPPTIEMPLQPRSGPATPSTNVSITGLDLVGSNPDPTVAFGPDPATLTGKMGMVQLGCSTSDPLSSTGGVTVSVTTSVGVERLSQGFMVYPDLAMPTASTTVLAPGPCSIAVGDFNRNGALDLATANVTDDSVSVMLDGGAPASVTVPNSPTAIAAGDFDRNGSLDLAVTNGITSTVSILTNNGAGTFTLTLPVVTVGSSPTALVVEDFDRNGSPDLAVTNGATSTVSILANDGLGTLSVTLTVTVGNSPTAIAAGDFDRDGAPDLAVANESSGTVSILSNMAGGVPGSLYVTQTITVSAAPASIAVADFNRDGFLDLAVANRGAGSLTIVLGTSTGFPATGSSLSLGFAPSCVAARDLNGDGTPELAVANPAGTGVVVMIGNGLGAFPYSTTASVAPCSPWCVAIAEMNGDGVPDLVTANAATGDLSVVQNQTPWVSQGVPGFELASTTTLSDGCKWLAVTDTDRNGSLDLVVPYYVTPGSIHAVKGKGIGRFDPTANATVSSLGSLAYAAVVGDMNRDGVPDVVVTNTGTNDLAVMLGTGSTFSAAGPFAAGSDPRAVAVGDLDRDGIPDVVVANNGGNNLLTFRGDGTGSLAALQGPIAVGGGPRAVETADLDGDGDLDVVLACSVSNTVETLMNNGSGTLGAPVSAALTASSGPEDLAAGDFNRDGSCDFATANATSGAVSILTNNGAGVLTESQVVALPVGSQPSSIAASDVDRDGDLELVVTCWAQSRVHVLDNAGSGTFSLLAGSYPTGTNPTAAVIGDLNGDGLPDIAVACEGTRVLSILLGL